MKLSDTVIGSIIIGVLVGGAVLYVGSREGVEETVKVADRADSSDRELRIELRLDSEELADKIEAADLGGKVEKVLTELGVASELEGALMRALESMPDDVTVNVEIQAKVNDSKESSGDGSVQ